MTTLGGSSPPSESSQATSYSRQKTSGFRPEQHRAMEAHVQSTRAAHQEWNTEVEKFRVSLQDTDASDGVVQTAWSQLRQAYRNTFNAAAYPHGLNVDLEPFPFWAAENLEDDVVERIIRVEFASSLASCALSRLKIAASQADLSIFTLILYFGNSIFSIHRLNCIRHRIHIFKRGTEDTWPFTEAYKRLLREVVGSKHKAPLDTTDIPWSGMPILFTESQLRVLGSANPEFERAAGTNDQKAAESNNTSLSGIPLSKKRRTTTTHSLAGKSVDSDIARDAQSCEKSVVQDSNAYAPKSEAGQSAATLEAPEDDFPFSIRPFRLSHQQPLARGGSPILPSIEFDELAAEASTSAFGNKQVSNSANFAMGFYERNSSSISRKRPVKEESDDGLGPKPAKRVNVANSKADLLLPAKDWDDDTVACILEQLAAIRPEKFTVVNCMEAVRAQLSLKIEAQQTLLMPFKLESGQRLLAVITPTPISEIQEARQQGSVHYLNPACCGEVEDRGLLSQIINKVCQSLGCILPGCDPNLENWHFQNWPYLGQSVNENRGLAICLMAMYVVAGPLKAPLTVEIDWMLWRHILLSTFLPGDRSVQLRTEGYLKDRVQRQVCQGQPIHVDLHNRERASDGEVQVSRKTFVRPVDRLLQRRAYARHLLQSVQEALHFLNNLTDYIYDARISVKISLDMASLQEQQSRLTTAAGCPLRNSTTGYQKNERQRSDCADLEEAEDSIMYLKTRLDKVYELHQCLKKGRDLLSEFRRDIDDAVLVDEESSSNFAQD